MNREVKGKWDKMPTVRFDIFKLGVRLPDRAKGGQATNYPYNMYVDR